MSLPGFSVRQRVTVLMLFLGLLLLGSVCLVMLGVDLLPESERPAVTVITAYPGASAEDVEQKVTKEIENQLSIVSNLDELFSTSRENLSIVTCTFDWNANLDEASNDVRDKLELAKRVLPDDIDDPVIVKFNTANFPVIFYGVHADQSWPRLRETLEDQLTDRLKTVPGVGAVPIFGGLERQVNVEVDLEKLKAYGLTLDELSQALSDENLTLPAGNMKIGAIDYTIRVPGEYTRIDEIPEVVLRQNARGAVRLRDVARVQDGFKEETRLLKMNGRPAVMFAVQKQSGANTVDVCRRVRAEVERLSKTLPADVRIVPVIDTSTFILRSVGNLAVSLIYGAVFVILVTLLFLRSLRESLIIILTIPFSLIITFIVMYAAGYTINIMSLASLAIALGMVVDNATVILENIHRHIEEGERVREASVFGASEVGLAVAASTLTTVVIFLPVAFIKGITGIFFRQLGLCITVAIVASLLASLMLTPMLASVLLKPIRRERLNRLSEFIERMLRGVENGYGHALEWALIHKGAILFIAAAMLLGSISLIPSIGTEFIPEEDSGDIRVILQLPVGARVEQTAAVAERIAEIFRDDFPKETVVCYYRAGQERSGLSSAFSGVREASYTGIVQVKLVPVEDRRQGAKEIAEIVGRQIQARADIAPYVAKISVETSSSLSSVLLGGGRKPLSVKVKGNDLEVTDRLAAQIRTIMQETEGTREVTISRDLARPEINVSVDRLKAGRLGVRSASVAHALRTYFYGDTATKYREHGDEYDVFVRLRDEDRTRIQNIADVTVPARSHSIVHLSEIATIDERLGPVEIDREDQQRVCYVEGRVFGRSLGEVAQDVEAKLATLQLPAGVSYEWGGMVKEQGAAFKWLLLALLLGIVLVYMVMAAQFESLMDPFVIMFSVPFAIVGVLVGLFVTGETLNVMSFIGLIMLVGVVVNNAIILVDYTNILRRRGRPLMEAVVTAGRHRLRPVLITTLTTIFGALPLAIMTGEGSEPWRPLGVSLLGGLTLSTLVTLVLVPTVYALVESRRERRRS